MKKNKVFCYQRCLLLAEMAHFSISNNESGFGTLYTGTCNDTALINNALHLRLNALLTLLLISSNYCSLVLSSPTPTKIDRGKAFAL
jgi:hypothetical protein